MFVDVSGLSLLPQRNSGEKKISLCLILNKSSNVLFDQIRHPEDVKLSSRLEREKYEIFQEKFELTPQGLSLIQQENLLHRENINIEGDNPALGEIKLSFIEYLVHSQRSQILIDILLHKVRRQGEDEEVFAMLELERCEELVYQIFEKERENTWFEYENVDRNKLNVYHTLLKSLLKIYDGIIKRKEEEALNNARALRTVNINHMEDEILRLFDAHRERIKQESYFCKVLEFVVDNDIIRAYNENFEEIKRKWNENRDKYNKLFYQQK